jgi:L-arabinose isomerase
MHPFPFKVGLFGVGLNTYWPQFDGLKARLQGYIQEVAQQIQRPDVEVLNLGLVDDIDKAFAASHALRQADVDLVFLYATTYAVSSTVLTAVARVKVPVVVLNLQPEAAIDYQRLNAMGV